MSGNSIPGRLPEGANIEWSQCYFEPGYLDESELPLGYALYIRVFARLLTEAETQTLAREFLRLIGLGEHQTVFSGRHVRQMTELRFFINRMHPKDGYFATIGDPHTHTKWIELWLQHQGCAGRFYVKRLPFEMSESMAHEYFEAGCTWAAGPVSPTDLP